MIQCARLAFGFAGIYDKDEAERIVENTAYTAERQPERDITPVNDETMQEINTLLIAWIKHGMTTYCHSVPRYFAATFVHRQN